MAIIKFWDKTKWVELYSEEIEELKNRCDSLTKVDIALPVGDKTRTDIAVQIANQVIAADDGVGEIKAEFAVPAIASEQTMKVSDAVKLLTRYAHNHGVVAGDQATGYQCQCQCRCDCQCDCNCDCNCCTHCVHAPPCVFTNCACQCQCDCNCACGDGNCGK